MPLIRERYQETVGPRMCIHTFALLTNYSRVIVTLMMLYSHGGPVSVTSQSSVEKAEQIELVFGTGALFDLSYTVVQGN